MTNEDIALACKIAQVGNEHFSQSDDGKALKVDLSDGELESVYGFNAQQVGDFRAILDGSFVPASARQESTALREGPRYYISNEALTAGTFVALATAAEAGPYALAAASTALGGVIGGPIGAAISGGIALLGVGFFIDLAAKIIGALAQGKGVALYPQWGFPPLESAIE
ncbi:hypothetical protein [Corynebacterium qintianiae]|uniref:hypothetical protein n=1 Tax=Corynebacterium qintianiae TaxID=2709392 RepID=UPI0013EE14FF|nr:hypothetical protein [Corynebacterium qintianiae]